MLSSSDSPSSIANRFFATFAYAGLLTVASSICEVEGVDRSTFVMGANMDFFSTGDAVIFARVSRETDPAVVRVNGGAPRG